MPSSPSSPTLGSPSLMVRSITTAASGGTTVPRDLSPALASSSHPPSCLRVSSFIKKSPRLFRCLPAAAIGNSTRPPSGNLQLFSPVVFHFSLLLSGSPYRRAYPSSSASTTSPPSTAIPPALLAACLSSLVAPSSSSASSTLSYSVHRCLLQPRCHLPYERARQRGKLDEKHRARPGVHLKCEVDMSPAVPEQGADDTGAKAGQSMPQGKSSSLSPIGTSRQSLSE